MRGGGASSDTDGGKSGRQRREEKKIEVLQKGNAADGQGDELCSLSPYRSGVKTGKADLFIKVSHPSAPYSSAPTNWE